MNEWPALIASAVLGGCAAAPADPSGPTDVPADRVFISQPPVNRRATLIAALDRTDNACYVAFFVDRNLVARLAPGERVRVPVESGERTLGAASYPEGPGLCVRTKPGQAQHQTTVSRGENKHIRLTGSAGGDVHVMLAYHYGASARPDRAQKRPTE